MRVLLTTGLVCTLVGASLGWIHATDKYKAEAAQLELLQHEAQNERNRAIGQLSTEYYQLYQDAINRPADVIERRVYVKADCVPAGQSSGVGDAAGAGGRAADSGAAGSAGKVALAQSTVDAVVSVADKHQRLYDMCRVKLEYFQNAYEQ